MCIRDRAYERATVAAALSGSRDDAILALALNPLVKDKAIACLLYTSDAADERSSVDPGGRRIIKKKKTKTRLASHQSVNGGR